MEERDYNTEETTPEVKKKTGAKKALATIGIIALCGLTAFGAYKGVEAYNDYKETKRAESLVSYYIDSD